MVNTNNYNEYWNWPILRNNRKHYQLRKQQQQYSLATINPNQPIPPAMIDPQAGEHLYMIGCSSYCRDPTTTRRYRFHSPKLFLSLIGFIFIRTITILLLPDEYDDQLIWIGDVSVVLRLKTHFNILLITFDYIIIMLHILHAIVQRTCHRTGKPPNNSPFNLVAGLITPRSIGLYDRAWIYQFVNFVTTSTRFVLLTTRYPMNIIVWSSFFIAMCLKMITMDSKIIWFISVGHSLMWMGKSHIFFTYFFFHILYFYIICFYLR